MMRYKFIVNPAAAGGKVLGMLPWLKSKCQHAGISYEIELTEKKDDARSLARSAAEHFTHIVAVGGDGTIHEIVNGLIGHKAKLAILPLGSGNDLARGLGLPLRFDKSFDILLTGNTKYIDIGKAGEHYFHNGMGIGFDAWVVYETLRDRIFHGKVKYFSGILKTIYKYQAPLLTLSYGGREWQDRFYMINIANGLYMGGGFKLTPDAKFDDGQLDLNIIINITKLKVFRHLLGVFSGKHTRLPEVTQAKAERIVITGEQPFAVQADGELIAKDLHSIEVTIIPKALEIVVV
jgi:diacylglycerol kinase (ATP)